MKLVFMGTPDFAVPSLAAIAEKYEVDLVVTRPDAVRGRGKKLMPSAVKVKAEELNIPVVEAKRVNTELLSRVRDIAPDVIVVAAYGCILPDELLSIPRLDCINVHASLLPAYRGAAPIQRAVFNGEEIAGVSIMRVVHDLDAGPYCKQASLPVADNSSAKLMEALSHLGADALLEALGEIEAGTATWIEQDETKVTYAAKITKQEMLLDPKDSALLNLRRIRASMDTAPARMQINNKGLRVLSAKLAEDLELSAGSVLSTKHALYVGTADGALELLRVKADGKKETDAAAFGRGLQGEPSWGAL